MARGRKNENPTNMARPDRIDTLRVTSDRLISKQAAAKAAVDDANSVKAAAKAAGMDPGIFNLLHRIRHTSDPVKKQALIDNLALGIEALLSDQVTPDLFTFAGTSAAAPEVKATIQHVSDEMKRAMPEDGGSDDVEDEELGEEDEHDASGDERPETESEEVQPAEDLPPVVAAADMPSDAGTVFNAGVEAGKGGEDAEANPYSEATPEHGLWERGRQRGVALAEEDDGATGADRFAVVPKDDSSLHQLKDVIADEVVFEHPDADLCGTCCAALNSAQAAADEPLTPDQIREIVQPLVPEGFGIAFKGRFVPGDGEPAAADEPAAPKRAGRLTRADEMKLYFVGFDGQKSGSEVAALVDGRSRGERKHITIGFEDALKGKASRFVRPQEPAAQNVVDSDQPVEAQELATEVEAAFDAVEEDPAAYERGIVDVREKDAGGHELYDTRTGAAVIDCNGPRSGETWANSINGHFAGREADVTHAELAEAGKTLALGRLLGGPVFTSAPPSTPDVFAAV